MRQMLSVSALFLIGGSLIAPVFVYAGSSTPRTPYVGSVPEPLSIALLGAGLAGIAIYKRMSK